MGQCDQKLTNIDNMTLQTKKCNYELKRLAIIRRRHGMLQNVVVPHLQASQDAEDYLDHLQEYHQKQQ